MEARVLSLWEQMRKEVADTTKRPIKSEATSTMNAISDTKRNGWVTQVGLQGRKRLREAEGNTINVSDNVAALWEKMNKELPSTRLNFFTDICASESADRKSSKPSNSWRMKTKTVGTTESSQKELQTVQNDASGEARKLAAAALAAVKNAAASTYVSKNRGKIEIAEVRDFAGQEIEVKKLVDAESREASEKGKNSASSAVDAVLEQIKKKQKLSVLDKTKKDWGEFKEENKGLEEELDAYKKSSNQYLDRVSFLERADYRQFEKERDARLALQARRRPDMRDN